MSFSNYQSFLNAWVPSKVPCRPCRVGRDRRADDREPGTRSRRRACVGVARSALFASLSWSALVRVRLPCPGSECEHVLTRTATWRPARAPRAPPLTAARAGQVHRELASGLSMPIGFKNGHPPYPPFRARAPNLLNSLCCPRRVCSRGGGAPAPEPPQPLFRGQSRPGAAPPLPRPPVVTRSRGHAVTRSRGHAVTR